VTSSYWIKPSESANDCMGLADAEQLFGLGQVAVEPPPEQICDPVHSNI
jgi:hypothetical protein